MRPCQTCVQGDSSWSLSEFGVLENRVLFEVGSDGSHQPRGAKQVSDGDVMNYHLGPRDIS